MDWSRPDRADALAAQYVAGTLRGRARARFESLLPAHPALQAAVQQWQARLLPLTGVLPEQAPPARVWRRIEARLFPAPPALRWWQRLELWRAFSGLALAGLVGLVVFTGRPQPALPPVVVVLESTGAVPQAAGGAIVASLSGDGRALVARPLVPVALPAQAPPDRVLELWSVPPQGNPRSLGLIQANGVTVLPRERLPATLLKGGTAALAVSVEPPGGSPTGVPTGPVVFAGRLTL